MTTVKTNREAVRGAFARANVDWEIYDGLDAPTGQLPTGIVTKGHAMPKYYEGDVFGIPTTYEGLDGDMTFSDFQKDTPGETHRWRNPNCTCWQCDENWQVDIPRLQVRMAALVESILAQKESLNNAHVALLRLDAELQKLEGTQMQLNLEDNRVTS